MKLNNRTDCIPNGFVYVHPESGESLGPENSIYDLIRAVNAYNRANNYGWISEEEIEHQNCVRYPDYCRPGGATETMRNEDMQIEAARQAGKVKPRNVIGATKTLAKWIVTGRRKADPDQIARRVAVCMRCPEHVGFEGCSACTIGKIRGLVKTVVGNTTVRQAQNLKVCAVCGCALEAKVQLPVEFLQTELDRLPSHCWIVTESRGQTT